MNNQLMYDPFFPHIESAIKYKHHKNFLIINFEVNIYLRKAQAKRVISSINDAYTKTSFGKINVGYPKNNSLDRRSSAVV